MPKCELCNDTEIIVWEDDDGYVMSKPCDCSIERDFKRRIKRSGLMDLVDNYSFDKYEVKFQWQKIIKDTALKFVKNSDQGNWFFIGGQVGAGKTMICTSIVSKLVEKGYEAYYMMWRNDIMDLKMKIDSYEEYAKKLDFLKNIRVLYIDDLFKGTNLPTEADLRILFDLINYRYSINNSITIISTERTIDEIVAIDQAIGSRIYQRCKDYSIKLAKNNELNWRMKGTE